MLAKRLINQLSTSDDCEKLMISELKLKSLLDSFKKFYANRHSGRKLNLLNQYSKGELQMLFTPQRYILQVSTYQMIVLLLFNEEVEWTVNEIQEKTNIEPELLIKILSNLLKNKILCFDELEEDFRESDSKMNSKIKLHNEFTSERIRVNLSMGSEPTREKDINETIDNDRELVIQVRINSKMHAC
ncbi:unnamed protein product, partial [Rotaria sordida]